jgi:hypothetical protein
LKREKESMREGKRRAACSIEWKWGATDHDWESDKGRKRKERRRGGRDGGRKREKARGSGVEGQIPDSTPAPFCCLLLSVTSAEQEALSRTDGSRSAAVWTRYFPCLRHSLSAFALIRVTVFRESQVLLQHLPLFRSVKEV